MLPNFHENEQILIDKVSIKYSDFKRGEVVIIKHPEDPGIMLIKRIVGLPGDIFEIADGDVFINNERLEEPYLLAQNSTFGDSKIQEGLSLIVPEGSYVLLGDNREDSLDSRSWGALDGSFIVGKGLLVYAPISNFRLVH